MEVAGLEPVEVYIKSISYRVIGKKMAKDLRRKRKISSFHLMSKDIVPT